MVLLYPIGIPLMLFVVMYTCRDEFRKLVEGLKQYDAEHNVISYVSDHSVLAMVEPQTLGRGRRPSMVTRAADLSWLASKVDKFDSTMWWTGSFLIGMRVMQTSAMVFITNPSLQASVACLIALIGINVQERNAPYRRPSE